MRIKYICILLLIWSAVSDRMQIHAETSSRIPALEYNLERLYKDYTLLKKVNSRLSADMNLVVVGEKIKVEVVFVNKDDIERFSFSEYGIEKDDYFGVFNNITQALVPVQQLKDLSENSLIKYIRVPATGFPDVVSEGVVLINASEFHNAGYTGKGAKIAVIDLGFYGYEDLLGTELPGNLITKSFYNSPNAGTGDIHGGTQAHGTAVAEIVYDVAPDARLYLVNMSSSVELDKAVEYCISEGVNIINHSVGWVQVSFNDGTGPICEIAEKAYDNGILWIASAGNYRKVHYYGSFSDPDNDQWHNFSENDNYLEILNVSINDTIDIGLTWNDWITSNNDYDFYLYYDDLGTMTVVDSSINIQNGVHYPPLENISAAAERDGRYYIGVKSENADGQAKLNIFCTSDHELEFISYENSYQTSTIDPAVSSKALAVGAINLYQDIIAPYSSEGPTTDGRVKPDICAPDGVSNATAVPHFYGTSAAAPHIAGAAGLLFEQNPTRTNSDLWTFLELSVIDLGETGKDNTYGSGILNLSLTKPVHDEIISGVPSNYALGQNYPNPFNNETIIEIKIPKLTFTSLKIYDIFGREVKVLINNTLIPGTYKIKWDGKNRDNGPAASGVYFIEMKTNNFQKIKKIVLLK